MPNKEDIVTIGKLTCSVLQKEEFNRLNLNGMCSWSSLQLREVIHVRKTNRRRSIPQFVEGNRVNSVQMYVPTIGDEHLREVIFTVPSYRGGHVMK